MRSLLIISLFVITLPIKTWAQDSFVFSQDQLLQIVKDHHPVALQAQVGIEIGESKVRSSRGSFDPQVDASYGQKYFDGKNYYSLLGTGLTIPTWFGADINAGLTQNEGIFLNPQNNVPTDGLWNAGISVPLGQGLIIDNRRAAMRQAQLFARSTQVEQEKMLNDLFFDALKKYWKWTEVWNQLQVYEESVGLAQTRFEAIRQSFELGDLPAIDTLEAFIQVQSRQAGRNDFRLRFQNASLELSNFLWLEGLTPLQITDSLIPPQYEELSDEAVLKLESLRDLIVLANQNHPELRLVDLKIDQLEIDRRLRSEMLKPKLNVEYNVLNEEIWLEETNEPIYNNYSWGARFSLPLFLRKERGELQMAKLKISESEISRDQKNLKIENNIRSFYNEIVNLNTQVDLYQNIVGNYRGLLNGERQKFQAGESSLFLINSREINLIDSQLDLIKLTTELSLRRSGIDWAAGVLYENILATLE